MNDGTRDDQRNQGTNSASEEQELGPVTESEARQRRNEVRNQATADVQAGMAQGQIITPTVPAGIAPSRARTISSGTDSNAQNQAMAQARGYQPTAFAESVLASAQPPPPLENPPFVVRGAKIYCTYGTHIRKLDMALTHGAFIRDKPMLNEQDCRGGVEENIAPFGICRSESNKGLSIEISEAELEDLVPIGVSIDGRAVVPDLPLHGRKCILDGIGQKWEDAHEEVIVGNKPALTMKCTLSCSFGGIIKFITDGQEVG